MNNRRKLIVALGAGALAAPLSSFAQKPPKAARIGYLGPTSAAGAASRIDALRAGLRELGYVEGKNLTIEFRWANDQYEVLPKLAAELVGLKVDLIVTHGTPGTRAAAKATTTIPVVMATAGDALLTGLVTNLAQPEGNITGSIFYNPEIAAKRLEVLRDTFPRIKRIAVLQNSDNPAMKPVLAEVAKTAAALKLELLQAGVRGPQEFDAAFAAMAKNRAEAVVIIEDAMLNGNLKRIADLAIQRKMPAIGLPEFADAGGLLAYGVDLIQMFRHAAVYVDKLLKGAKVRELPVERASTFETVLNLKTAKALGVKFPDAMRIRANRVIG
jgi:putative ABC transport system substrate-binding protein